MNQKEKRLLRTLWRVVDTLNVIQRCLEADQARIGQTNPHKTPEWNERNQQAVKNRIEADTRRLAVHLRAANSLTDKRLVQFGLAVESNNGRYTIMQWDGQGGLKEAKR